MQLAFRDIVTVVANLPDVSVPGLLADVRGYVCTLNAVQPE